MEVDTRKLYRHLDAVRTQRHLSWRDIAKQTRLARSTIARIESGCSQPRPNTVARLRSFLRLSERAFAETFAAGK